MHQQTRAFGCIFLRSLTVTATTLCVLVCAPGVFAGDEKIPQIQHAAEKGKLPQEVKLADSYFVGRGVPQNLKMAAYWYEKAAEHGDPTQKMKLATCIRKASEFHLIPLAPATGTSWRPPQVLSRLK